MRPIPTSTCAIFKKQLQYFYNIMKGGEGAQRGMGGYIESKLDILDGVKPDGVWVKVECIYTYFHVLRLLQTKMTSHEQRLRSIRISFFLS